MSWFNRRKNKELRGAAARSEEIQASLRQYDEPSDHRLMISDLPDKIVEGSEANSTSLMPRIQAFEPPTPPADAVLVQPVDLEMIRLHAAKDALEGVLRYGHGGGNWRRIILTKIAEIKEQIKPRDKI